MMTTKSFETSSPAGGVPDTAPTAGTVEPVETKIWRCHAAAISQESGLCSTVTDPEAIYVRAADGREAMRRWAGIDDVAVGDKLTVNLFEIDHVVGVKEVVDGDDGARVIFARSRRWVVCWAARLPAFPQEVLEADEAAGGLRLLNDGKEG